MNRLLALPIALALCAATSAPGWAYDLSNKAELLEAYVKTVGDLSGDEVVLFAKSKVMGILPGEKGQPLFGMAIIGVKRYEKIDNGYQRIQREIAYYTDLDTGEILTEWTNPFTGRTVKVIPVLNDPVNRQHLIKGDQGTWTVNHWGQGDQVIFHREVLLRYPNPLPRKAYPRYSSGDWYEATELFNNFVRRSDLEDPSTTSAPGTGSWSRRGPWLPWMEMGAHQGFLMYHGSSVKLMGGIEDIPERYRDHTRKHYPKYLKAPDAYSQPSETSWTYFKKLIDSGAADTKD